MATPNPNQILRAPGRLVINPTDLGAAFPYGGTALGIVKAIAIRPGAKYQRITAEEYGGEVVEMVGNGEAWTLAAILRDFDHDAVAKLFGTVSAGNVVTYPGSVRAGRLMSDLAVKLLFAPNNPAVAPACLFYRALPLLEDAAAMSMSRAAEFGVSMVFVALRNGSDPAKAVAMGPLGSLSL